MSDAVQPARTGLVSFEGHDLHWEYFGDGGREVISLFNGLAMHTPAWYGFLPRLQLDYDVLLWDYPGQGSSSSHDVPYFIDRIAAGLEAILDVYLEQPDRFFTLLREFMAGKERVSPGGGIGSLGSSPS